MKTNEMVKRLRRVGVLLWSNEGGVTRPILSGGTIAEQMEGQREEIKRLHRLIDGRDHEVRRLELDLTELRYAIDGLLTEFGLAVQAERDDKERVEALRFAMLPSHIDTSSGAVAT